MAPRRRYLPLILGAAIMAPAGGRGLHRASAADCNTNSTEDAIELAQATARDCNTNAHPDECDLATLLDTDCNTNGTPDGCELPARRAATGIPVVIPNNQPGGAGVRSDISVSDPRVVARVSVQVSVKHSYDADIEMFLIHGTTTVELSSDNGAGGDDYVGTVFDDQAGNSIANSTVAAAPFQGTFRPEQPLSALCGVAAAGTWTLNVRDDASGNTGTLQAWSLLLAVVGGAADCNTNNTMDYCEIHPGGLTDCDGNGTLDLCEFVDCDTDGRFDACDILGGTSADCDRNGRPDACEVGGALFFRGAAPHAALPADGSTPWLGSMTLLAYGAVSDVNVRVDIEHPADDQLDVYLIHGTTTVELATDVGGTGDHFTNTVFDDAATRAIDDANFALPPFTGTYRPEGSLGAFNHQEQAGAWTLMVLDDTFGSTGSLAFWFLEVRSTHPDCNTNGTPDACEDCNTNGSADACDLSAGTTVDANTNGTLDACDANCPTCRGDVNGDGRVDGGDVAGFVRCFISTPATGDHVSCADAWPIGTGDGIYDGDDLAAFIARLLSTSNMACP